MKTISVCYVLSYYSPDYIRTKTLIEALKRIENIELYQVRNTSKGVLRYLQSLWKLLIVRILYNPEVYILGFRGYELYWLVRLFTLGKSLIYDHMMSPYDSILNEYKLMDKECFLAELIFLYERSILYDADVVLTDTEIHAEFFQDLFHLKPQKVIPIPVGADETLLQTMNFGQVFENLLPFELLYYGSFLPLHGMEIIVKAALLLRDYPIHFTLIGDNKINSSILNNMIEQFSISNITRVKWVEFKYLPGLIARTKVGLGGPFGNTPQARRVITGKTFQFLAMAKPVIVGEIDMDCGFIDKENCLIVHQGNANALADAIHWAYLHPAELQKIGERGCELYKSRYSINKISSRLERILNHEISSSTIPLSAI